MRILTCLATLEIGGSQINAIELGRELSRMGHEVVVFGPDGELTGLIEEFGLEFVAAPFDGRPPSPRNCLAIRRLVRARKIDIVHAYEYGPALEAGYGAYVGGGVPILVTVLSAEVPQHYVPSALPLVVGTVELAREQRQVRPRTYLIEPPVDTEANAPVADRGPARARFGLGDDEVGVFVVCRLAAELKREGLITAARAVGEIGARTGVHLFIVGDGPCREEIQQEADRANAKAGREVVTLTGQLLDPHDAYAAADIMLGMGGSALRAMAFERPLVVQGERGFWRLLTPDTLQFFLDHGWYGLGDGQDGTPAIARILTDLAADRQSWAELGALGRSIITTRFSLETAAKSLAEIYRTEAGQRRPLLRRVAVMVPPTGHVLTRRVRDTTASGLVRRARRGARAVVGKR